MYPSIEYNELKDFMFNVFGNYIKPQTIKLHRFLRYFDISKEYLTAVKTIMHELKIKDYKVERYRESYWEITYLVEYFDDEEEKKALYETIERKLDFDKILFNGTNRVTPEYNPTIFAVDMFKYYIFQEVHLEQITAILESLGQNDNPIKLFDLEDNHFGTNKIYWVKLHGLIPVGTTYPHSETAIGRFEEITRRANISTCGFTDHNGEITFFKRFIEQDNRISNVGFRKDLREVFLSSYEANIARVLNYKNIEWEFEKHGFSLKSNVVKVVNEIEIDSMGYFPDFFLNDNKIIEVKGFWDKHSINKVSSFISQKNDYQLFIIDGDMLHSLDRMYKERIIDWEDMKLNIGSETLPVVGITRPERVKHVKLVKVGDEVLLSRDFNNEYDKNAIQVLNLENNLLGFIGKDWAAIYAQKMDVGMRFKVTVKSIEEKVIYISVKRKNLNYDAVFEFLLP